MTDLSCMLLHPLSTASPSFLPSSYPFLGVTQSLADGTVVPYLSVCAGTGLSHVLTMSSLADAKALTSCWFLPTSPQCSRYQDARADSAFARGFGYSFDDGRLRTTSPASSVTSIGGCPLLSLDRFYPALLAASAPMIPPPQQLSCQFGHLKDGRGARRRRRVTSMPWGTSSCPARHTRMRA
jgi:hypothetical protein